MRGNGKPSFVIDHDTKELAKDNGQVTNDGFAV